MLESLLRADRPAPVTSDGTLLGALERASGAIARLDQALDNHPLRTAFLYRARLEAVRRQASVDGHGIDPWHLAAVLEGLRLRMDHALRIVDRGQIFEAARSALTLHQWIVEPDFDQEGEIQEAERHLANASGLVGVGEALWSWLDSGRTRPPVRGALVRFWTKNRLLRAPVPLTGPRALSAEAPHGRADWMVAFLEALAGEATDYMEMLRSLERGWMRRPRPGSRAAQHLARGTRHRRDGGNAAHLGDHAGQGDRHVDQMYDRVAGPVRSHGDRRRGHASVGATAVWSCGDGSGARSRRPRRGGRSPGVDRGARQSRGTGRSRSSRRRRCFLRSRASSVRPSTIALSRRLWSIAMQVVRSTRRRLQASGSEKRQL